MVDHWRVCIYITI